MLTTHPVTEDAPPVTPPPSARALRARRRALLAIGGVAALLVLLWFSDTLAGLLPTTPYAPTTQSAGSYRVTLAIAPTLPHAGAPIHAHLTLTDAARHPLPAATVTYTWEMLSMDMGTASGTATSSSGGPYAATVTATMGGRWRLTVHVHTPHSGDASTSFDIQVHN